MPEIEGGEWCAFVRRSLAQPLPELPYLAKNQDRRALAADPDIAVLLLSFALEPALG